MSEKEKRAKEAIQAALATCVSEPFGQAVLKDLLETRNLDELKATFKKWRRIGWKNVCKLWLEERTPEQLKGEGD
jgi:hypothetical protein